MQLKEENFPLTVKDHLVSNEEFTLVYDGKNKMLVTKPQPEGCKLIQYYESDHPYPLNFYAQTKQIFSDILSKYGKEQGFQFVNLIIFESYGPRDWRKKLIQAIAQNQRSGGTLNMVSSDPIMDFAHIDDIVDAYIQAAFLLESDLKHVSGHSYALTGGERQSISELVKIFEEIGGKLVATKKKDDLPGIKRVLVPWNGPTLPGWQPKISLREGIKRFLEDV